MKKYQKILICGERSSGKSTLITRLSEYLPTKYGFITKINPTPDINGFMYVYIHPLCGSERRCEKSNCVGRCKGKSGSSQGYAEIFDTLGANMLTDIPRGSVVIMDELGFMENDAHVFQQKVMEIFDGEYNVIAAIKARSTPFLEALKSRCDVTVINIDSTNRDEIFELLKNIAIFVD